MTYTFDFVNHDGSIDHFDLGRFSDDRAALKAAEAALLASTSAVRIAVWNDGGNIGEVRRPRARRAPLHEHASIESPLF
jgi:hypothetical protein